MKHIYSHIIRYCKKISSCHVLLFARYFLHFELKKRYQTVLIFFPVWSFSEIVVTSKWSQVDLLLSTRIRTPTIHTLENIAKNGLGKDLKKKK